MSAARIHVLTLSAGDHGYIERVDWLGNDLTPVNAARASYNDRSTTMTARDERLTKFLVNHDHTSPFRHPVIQFEVQCPLLVARQWEKHRVGAAWQYGSDRESKRRVEVDEVAGLELVVDDRFDPLLARNEMSRRYVRDRLQWYIPTVWRAAPANSKQGSGGPLDPITSLLLTSALEEHIERSEQLYQSALESGAAAEEARLFLPAYALHTRFYWTASLEAVLHFIHLREEHDAQAEVQEYARAMKELIAPIFPVTLAAFETKWQRQRDLAAEVEQLRAALADAQAQLRGYTQVFDGVPRDLDDLAFATE